MSKLKTYKFSDLYTMSSGISSKPEQAGHGSPFVSFKTVFNNYFLPDILEDLMYISDKEKEIYSVKKGDIFLTRTSETLDELGMSSVAIKDYTNSSFSGFLKRLRPNQSDVTYDKFMAFYLRSDLFRKTMTNNSIMTLRASLNEQIFSYLELVLPDYKEQKKAGDFLYSINQKIDINNKINIELELLAKSIYEYWFVQYDFPNEKGNPYKSSGGEMILNEELKREIPKGWTVENLNKNNLTKLIKPNVDIFKGTKTYLATSDVTNDKVNFNAKKINYQNRETRANMQPIKNSIWFAKMKNSKKIIHFLDTSTEMIDNIILSTGFAGLQCKKNALEYVWNFINDDDFEFIKDRLASGATQEAINNESMKLIPLLVPENLILEKYHLETTKLYELKYKNTVQNQQLTELRDWLLPMLMNGQVTVSSETNIGKDEVLAMVAEPSTVYEKTVKVVLENVATKKSKREKTPVVKLNNVDVYKRTLLAAEIVFQYKNEYTLGHLKLQKMLYLCKESESMNLPMNFLKQAMGPYDNQLARSLDKQFEEKKWFKYQNGDGLKYIPMENCGKHSEDFKKYFEDQLPTIHSLITTFKKFKSQDIEAVGTLFACWKEAILNNELTNDIIIIKKFYEWSDEKIKFKEADLIKHLNWMRVNSIYPIINK